MPSPNIQTRTALISVSDKTGVIDLARALITRNIQIISSGGTARALREANIDVTPVEEITGAAEMLGGRVKTLHPNIHGAILARHNNTEDAQTLRDRNITPIDLVCVNLYPFEETVAAPDVTEESAVEQIDIGGPAMIRAAAKNFQRVTVLTTPTDYTSFLEELSANDGATTLPYRKQLAVKAFAQTNAYDAAIVNHFTQADDRPNEGPLADPLPPQLNLSLTKVRDLRYGENPHQRAAVYSNTPPNTNVQSLPTAHPLHGKQLSYNNLNDAAAAIALVADLATLFPNTAAAAIIKHTNPCGAAVAPNISAAITQALAGDPLAAFGAIVAANHPIDEDAATLLIQPNAFLEVIVCPNFTQGAHNLLASRWKNVRLIEVDIPASRTLNQTTTSTIPGGALVQSRDLALPDTRAWTHTAGPAPSQSDLRAAAALWIICKHLTSNAVAIGAKSDADTVSLFGAGAGQMDRVAACKLAIEKAGPRAHNAIAASDAFFPFPDGPKLLVSAGVRIIVHPGGSKRDDETFALCNNHNITCLTTGVRHFRH